MAFEFERDGKRWVLTAERVDNNADNRDADAQDVAAAFQNFSTDDKIGLGNLLLEGLGDASYMSWDRLTAELRKHQDLVEALQWLPADSVLSFYDVDDFLEELRGKPHRWLPVRECKHKGNYPRCIKCRNGDD